MKVLFICNQGRHRSRTAAEIFKDRFETKYAGLFNEAPLDEKTLEWADLIVVMTDSQRSEIAKRFPKQYLKKRILSLEIPDVYSYMQPELVEMLNLKMNEIIQTIQ